MRYREPLRARRLEMGRAPIFCAHCTNIAQNTDRYEPTAKRSVRTVLKIQHHCRMLQNQCKPPFFAQKRCNVCPKYDSDVCDQILCTRTLQCETTISSSNPRESNPSSNLQMFNLLVSLDPRTLEDVRSPLSPGSVNYYWKGPYFVEEKSCSKVDKKCKMW